MKTAGFALSVLLLAGLALAAPMPLQLIVNNESMQCARFLPGDECMDCTPPEGWKILGPYVSCPENYRLVTVSGNCSGFENEHCCTQGHSGASGDCRNLARNDLTKQCAFFKDSSSSELPAGWKKLSANDPSVNWVCPSGYTWTTLGAIGAATEVAKFGPINVATVNDADFQATSESNISGWMWLTQPKQSATWNFYNLPTDRKLYIYLTPLVTRPSGRGGGSGYSTDVKITYSTRTGSINATVSLKNTHPEFQMPADTMGWGYQTIGHLTIPADKIPLDGNIRVTLTKFPNAEHIAVNKACCSIEYV